MKKNNVLPYDGETILIHDNSADFDWAALTRMLIGTIPWQVETAQLFGRELVVPRLTAWFGDAAYSYSGILHRPLLPITKSIERRSLKSRGDEPLNKRHANTRRASSLSADEGARGLSRRSATAIPLSRCEELCRCLNSFAQASLARGPRYTAARRLPPARGSCSRRRSGSACSPRGRA